MAVASPIPAIPEEVDPIRYTHVEVDVENMGQDEITEEPPPSTIHQPPPSAMIEDKIYVMVGKEVKKNEFTLKWAVHNSGGRKLCICHVHQPAQKIPIMGTNFSVSQPEEQQVRAYHETKRGNMNKTLSKYSMICDFAGVQADKLYIERESIEKGIVELITQHDIRKLVMGAAADKLYKKMTRPSKKAIYVHLQAPASCHIWFICKGHLIYTRESRLDRDTIVPLSLPASPNIGVGRCSNLRSQSVTKEQDHKQLTGSAPGFLRTLPDNCQMKLLALPLPFGTRVSTPCSMSNVQASSDEWDRLSGGSAVNYLFSSCSSSLGMEDLDLIACSRTRGIVNDLELSTLHCPNEDHHHSSPPGVLDKSTDDDLHSRLDQYVMEAENSRREAFEESNKCRNAEKEATEATCRVKAAESLYSQELRHGKEIEEALGINKEETERMKEQLNEAMEELRVAQEQKYSMENQIANSYKMVEELEEKIFSAVELLQKYKKERNELQVERDNTLRVAEEMRKKKAEASSSTSISRFFYEFPVLEIEEATRKFDPSLKIGEGGYGRIYRGILRHTPVAIKILNADSLQGPSEFQQEVNILSKLRHPNIVTLMGACPEDWILIYEYLPNGSLEDRLGCKDNAPPLSWQTRIRIAAELCSVLIFLHSSSPHSIVHGDLKPSNILLDANYMSKVSDFGICRVLSQEEYSRNHTTPCCRTGPKGTFSYIDPEFLETGELTPKSDVYSFGIILLRLLTGRPPLGIKKEVEYALDVGSLKDLLDPTAGDWPFVQAKQLAHLAMSCCDINRRTRPDLASEVWRVLEPMKISCGFSSLRLGPKENCQIPSYFICPIFQEIMQDPVVAADGFTYEAEALRGWLDGGHDTSPMTNLQLPHCNLVPNRALRSAIQEWLQQK